MNRDLKILFFGDITGRQGRNALKSFLASSDLSNTFVIANIENASHGFGLTKKIIMNYQMPESIVLLPAIIFGIRKMFMSI